MVSEIKDILNLFNPIGLEEMDNVKLMDRIDTKYILSASQVLDLLGLMKDNYKVLEINGQRISSYETTYLDTSDYLFFNQHVTGRLERSKVRFRKYSSTGITFLEIKRKTRKLRTIKWRIENNLDGKGCDIQAREFINRHFSFNSELLNPVITNRFNRITLVGSKTPERITLDMDLSFKGTDGQKTDLPGIAIAELKSKEKSVKSAFITIIKQLQIHPSGFSKYCIGNSLIYDIPRKNILKPTLLLINKIENEYNRSISA